jgi:6-phosphogluconolactonase
MTEGAGSFDLLGDAHAVAVEAARVIRRAAASAIARCGQFHLVLAGGRTPLTAYTLLVGESADWDRWHIFLGDERCLAPQDPGRSSAAIAQAFSDRVPIPRENLLWIPAERGPATAARDYESAIAARLPFDLVLLGMGEDGHTASLFPGHEIPADRLVMPVYNAPKPPPERVSLTPRALTDCRELLILVTGAQKRRALAAWRSGIDLPVARVASRAPCRVLVDRDAAGIDDGPPP